MPATATRATFNLSKECKGSHQFKEEITPGAPEVCGSIYVSKSLPLNSPATVRFEFKKECKHSIQFAETGETDVCGSLYVKKDVIGEIRAFEATITRLDAASVALEICL